MKLSKEDRLVYIQLLNGKMPGGKLSFDPNEVSIKSDRIIQIRNRKHETYLLVYDGEVVEVCNAFGWVREKAFYIDETHFRFEGGPCLHIDQFGDYNFRGRLAE